MKSVKTIEGEGEKEWMSEREREKGKFENTFDFLAFVCRFC